MKTVRLSGSSDFEDRTPPGRADRLTWSRGTGPKACVELSGAELTQGSARRRLTTNGEVNPEL